MLEFLYRAAARLSQRGLEDITKAKETINMPWSSGNQINARSTFLTSAIRPCPACRRKSHPLFRCEQFRNLAIPERIEVVKDAFLCTNCLRDNHKPSECKASNCMVCNKKHNTLLHQESSQLETYLLRPTGQKQRCISSTASAPMGQLMTSAVIYLLDKERQPVRCRALLDTCSSANFITTKLATELRLPKRRCFVPVGALNDLTTTAQAVAKVTIRSTYRNYEKTLSFLTIPRIAEIVSNDLILRDAIQIPPNIQLADPHFYKPAPVDVLLGCGPSLSALCGRQIDLSRQGRDLILQKSQLGWVIGGSLVSSSSMASRKAKFHLSELRSKIAKFWDLEEGFGQIHLAAEAIACEEHFQTHTRQNFSGRYVIALPFRDNCEALGESRTRALKRLNVLERKFKQYPDFQRQYFKILEEYLDLGHMSLEGCLTQSVVFDASAKSESGLSLNDTLMVGPTLQDDIFSHLLRFRFHNYVLTGDIEKMYRQFEIQEEDRKFQRILWRRDGINVQAFELNTITFGISSSPYLAIRALRELADDECHEHAEAAIVLKTDLYVDDLITRAKTVEEGIQVRDGITKLLNLGCLNIRQWASNDMQLLKGIPESSINKNLQFSDDKTLKTLGITWSSVDDKIIYFMSHPSTNSKVLLVDPLGLLGPITLFAKILMQRLWESKLEWDESIPESIHRTWLEFRLELALLKNFNFDRKLLTEKAVDIQLHGFCDASEKGYGACIYIRSTNIQGHSESRLLCAKSRVAPLKTPESISIARLELCGAQLLARLYATVNPCINVSPKNTFFWTDSTIVYFWINTSPHRLETFMANRTAEI